MLRVVNKLYSLCDLFVTPKIPKINTHIRPFHTYILRQIHDKKYYYKPPEWDSFLPKDSSDRKCQRTNEQIMYRNAKNIRGT